MGATGCRPLDDRGRVELLFDDLHQEIDALEQEYLGGAMARVPDVLQALRQVRKAMSRAQQRRQQYGYEHR